MSQGDTWFNITALTNATSGEESTIYRISSYSKTSVIAAISLGTLDVSVSNDGTNFVTRTQMVASGCFSFYGYSYIKLVVSSGTVVSASITSHRRFPNILDGPIVPSRQLYGRIKSRRGWSKGRM